MDHDELGAAEGGTFDWDAAFEAIVAPLRLPRPRRVARVVGSALVAAAMHRGDVADARPGDRRPGPGARPADAVTRSARERDRSAVVRVERSSVWYLARSRHEAMLTPTPTSSSALVASFLDRALRAGDPVLAVVDAAKHDAAAGRARAGRRRGHLLRHPHRRAQPRPAHPGVAHVRRRQRRCTRHCGASANRCGQSDRPARSAECHQHEVLLNTALADAASSRCCARSTSRRCRPRPSPARSATSVRSAPRGRPDETPPLPRGRPRDAAGRPAPRRPRTRRCSRSPTPTCPSSGPTSRALADRLGLGREQARRHRAGRRRGRDEQLPLRRRGRHAAHLGDERRGWSARSATADG